MTEGIIFDFDGTLFDSMWVWRDRAELFLKAHGAGHIEADLFDTVKSMSLAQTVTYLRKTYRLELSEEEIAGEINRSLEKNYFEDILPKEGVPAFLRELKQRNIRCCIATATDRYLVEAAIRRCGLTDCFDRMFTCSEVGKGKKHPDIFRQAADFMGLSHDKVTVFEDAVYSARTAKADGFTVCGVYDSYENEQDEMDRLADVRLYSYLQLDAVWNFLLTDHPKTFSQNNS